MFLKFNLKKKNIACCLTCYSETAYVYSCNLRNVILSFLSLVNVVLLIGFVMFAPSAIYIFAAALASTVIALLINGFKHIELRCKECQKSLITDKEHQW